MMKHLLRATALIFFALTTSVVEAQTYTVVTSTNMTVDNGSGTAINPPSGSTLCFTGVNASGQPITYTPAGGSPVSGPVCRTFNGSGGLTSALNVANGDTASPTGLRYTIVIANGSTVYLTLPLVQVHGSLFQIDQYSIPSNGSVTGYGYPHIACNAGANWTSTSVTPGASTCQLISGIGVWTAYPQAPYCPAGQGYLAPSGSGIPLCLSPTTMGVGVPTGVCVNKATYFQTDTTSFWGCFNSAWLQIISGTSGTPGGPSYAIQSKDPSTGSFAGDGYFTRDSGGNINVVGKSLNIKKNDGSGTASLSADSDGSTLDVAGGISAGGSIVSSANVTANGSVSTSGGTGARVVANSTGVTGYNSSNTAQWSVANSNGSASFAGGAATVSSSGTLSTKAGVALTGSSGTGTAAITADADGSTTDVSNGLKTGGSITSGGPVSVAGSITATGAIYTGGTGTPNQACTPANGLCYISGSVITGIRYGNGGSPDTVATAAQIATGLTGATLPNGVSATTQATSDNTTALATDEFVQNVKATIPTSTTINTVSCNLGSSCTVPYTCAGASCPNGTQIAVVFTTSSLITVTANATTTDTSFTVSSTSGFPSVGCGEVQNGVTSTEQFCWNGKDATHLLNLTRGYYGSTPVSMLAANNPFIFGYPNTLSTSSSSLPTWIQYNDGRIKYFPTVVLFTGISGGIVNNVSTTSTTLSATTNTNATSGANSNSGTLNATGSIWNGSIAAADTWRWTGIVGSGTNPTSTFTLSHPTGTSGALAVSMPYAVTVSSIFSSGGTINGTSVGSSSPASGNFTSLSSGNQANLAQNITTRASALLVGGQNVVFGDGEVLTRGLYLLGQITVTSSYAVDPNVTLVLVDSSSGNLTITLPASNNGQAITIKKVSSDSNTITITTPSSNHIDGTLTKTITAQWGSYTVVATVFPGSSGNSDYAVVASI